SLASSSGWCGDRLRGERQTGVGPAAEPALQDPHVTKACTAKLSRHPGARGFVGSRAVGDDRALGVDVEGAKTLLELFGREVARLLDLDRALGVRGSIAHVQDEGRRARRGFAEPEYL